MFGAYHGTKSFSGLVASQVMARMGKPELIRETSRLYSTNVLTLPFAFARKQALMRFKQSEEHLLKGVILEKKLED